MANNLADKKPLHQQHRFNRFKARWPAWLVLFTIALLYEALPKVFYWGPRGLMISLVTILMIPLIITFWRNNARINFFLGLIANILITLYMLMSLSRIVLAVWQGHIGPIHLLVSSITLWVSNVLIFALWYWHLDAGGQSQRELNESMGITAFLFPQAQINISSREQVLNKIKNWEPHLIDYLFLAFNTSTAFSPTDTPVLTRWAKCMCMIQALVSLTIVLMLAARAINILNPNPSYFVS